MCPFRPFVNVAIYVGVIVTIVTRYCDRGIGGLPPPPLSSVLFCVVWVFDEPSLVVCPLLFLAFRRELLL